jgi:hypothetical protein
MFAGSGFDARRMSRASKPLGHAYLSPQPGFFLARRVNLSARDLRSAPFDGSHLQTPTAGAMDHRSILEAQRAVGPFRSGAGERNPSPY